MIFKYRKDEKAELSEILHNYFFRNMATNKKKEDEANKDNESQLEVKIR